MNSSAEAVTPTPTPRVTRETIHRIFHSFAPRSDFESLRRYYAEDLIYIHPLHFVRGIDPFIRMNRRVFQRFRRVNMDIGEIVEEGPHIFLTWSMRLIPKFLGPSISVEGASHLRINETGKIAYHRDFWDPFGSLIEAVPGVRVIYRAVRKRLISALT